MNEADRENLAYILATAQEGEDQLTEFLDTLDDDNLEYALELLTRFKAGQDNLVDTLFA